MITEALAGTRTSHPYFDAVKAEASRWPGAHVTYEQRAKHAAFRVWFEGESRMVVVPSTPSDGERGQANALRDLRKELRALGASKTAQPKAIRAKALRKPAEQRSRPVLAAIRGTRADGPRRDPWEALEQDTPRSTTAPHPRPFLDWIDAHPLIALALGFVGSGLFAFFTVYFTGAPK